MNFRFEVIEMLSKETIDALRKQAQRDGMAYQRKLIDHIDALQAQLDKLQDDYTAQCLALTAANTFLQAETERADANEQDAKRYATFRNASMDERNRLEHYSGSALDAAIDTAIDANHATIQPLSTKE